MVVQGNFSLRLINANTLKPIEEHCSETGKTFVTLSSNVDFWVELTALQEIEEGRRIVYQTTVSHSAATSRHKRSKRRQRLLMDKPDIFRFEKTTAATQPYDSVAKETVTVRVFEATDDGKKRHLETITLHCCVLPSLIQLPFPERFTSLGTLLANSNHRTSSSYTNPVRGGCLLKKSAALSSVRGSTAAMGPSWVL